MRGPGGNAALAIILAASLLIRLFLYSDHPPLWDPSVYLLMGRYVYSHGSVGLWEPLRAPVWPLVLGFFWRLGPDQIFWGKVLELFFSLGVISLTCLIGRRVFDEETGIVAALLLSCSPTLFFWGNCAFTGIPSTFFAVAAVLLFFRGRHFSSGIVSSLAFMTRFAQLVAAVIIPAAALGRRNVRHRAVSIMIYAAGFLLVLGPYLVSNLALYGDAVLPFKQMREANSQVPVIWKREIVRCLGLLLRGEGLPLIFVLPGAFFCLRKPADSRHAVLVLLGVCSVVWIALFPWAVMRLVVPGLPYLSLLAACGITGIVRRLPAGRAMRVAFWAALLSFALFRYIGFGRIVFPPNLRDPFQRYVAGQEGAMRGRVWISNPRSIVYSDLRADELIYYPVFTAERAKELREKLPRADVILFSVSDFPCVPRNDPDCLREKRRFMEDIASRLTPVFNATGPSGEIAGGVFRRRTAGEGPYANQEQAGGDRRHRDSGI